MARLIYTMLASLDGFTEDVDGNFAWARPARDVHVYVNQAAASVGTWLYGRRMYETMEYWETAHTIPEQPDYILDWAQHWQETEKIVYSRTLDAPRTARTRIEREFDAEAVRRLKASASRDIAIAGPELAAHAIRAGLVDEIELIAFPVIVGGGKQWLPDGVRLDLALIDEGRFEAGVVALHYTVGRWSPHPGA